MAEIRLTGTMTSPPGQIAAVRAALADHMRQTRAEPGCLAFDVTETTPGVFAVSERFADKAAFDAHQVRAGASPWAEATRDCVRDYKIIQA